MDNLLQKFKVGEKAYLLTTNRGRKEESTFTEVEIVAVGRKYVSLRSGAKFFLRNDDDFYLEEKVSCGWQRYLFLSKEEVENYLEKESLEKWLRTLDYFTVAKFSLEQLRKVKEILEP